MVNSSIRSLPLPEWWAVPHMATIWHGNPGLMLWMTRCGLNGSHRLHQFLTWLFLWRSPCCCLTGFLSRSANYGLCEFMGVYAFKCYAFYKNLTCQFYCISDTLWLFCVSFFIHRKQQQHGSSGQMSCHVMWKLVLASKWLTHLDFQSENITEYLVSI